MFTLFMLSLIGLCIAAIVAFIVALRNRSWVLAVFVPLIAVCGSSVYFSYISVLGFPVQMEWEQMPEKITVVYFRVVPKKSVTLWLFENRATRLIELPYSKPAEEGLEKGRSTMGKAIPVTFSKKGGGKGKDGKGAGGRGNGDGMPGKGKGSGKGEGGKGWRYRIESKGMPIPDGSLPPKF